jgi:nucleoside-diphosphate-sugar epimerase
LDPHVKRLVARYDMAPATRDFGYVPRVTIAEGLARLKESYRT